MGAGLAMAVGLLFFFEALGRGSAAVVVPLTALYPAITVLLSRIFLQEALTLRHLVGLALALAAAWLLVQIVRQSRLGRGRHGFVKKIEITGKMV